MTNNYFWLFKRNNTHTHENARARIIETGALGSAPAGCLCQPNACSRLLTLKCFCECLLTLHENAVFAIRTLQNKQNLHFFTKIFAYIIKKQYLCTVIKN